MNEASHTLEYLREGLVLLGAALVFVLIFRRLGLGAVLGYLLAGALIGPHGLGLMGDAQGKLGFAELGIVLLLFLVGLELNPGRLWRLRRDIFGFGLVQVVLCGLALTGMILAFTKFSWEAALALGLPLALSSTAQVLPMLQSAGRLNTPLGERTFAVLLFQDLSIVPLITIIAALSRAPVDPSAPPGFVLALYTVGAIVGLVLAGRYIINPLFRLIGGLGERELFVAAGLFTVVASAALMQSLGLSAALGAFIAGVMLADSPYRHELEANVEPFRTILLGLFFIAVGMMLDLSGIAQRPLFVIGLAAGVVAIKAGVIFALARFAFGMERRQAIATGLLLSQGGEFGFVLFAQAAGARLIAPEAASLFGAVVTLSMMTTPFLMAVARRFSGPPPERDDLETPEELDGTKAIVVGYGRFGQTVAQMLRIHGASLTLIDNKPAQIDRSSRFGSKVYYGDGMRLDLLRRAGAGEAQVIALCVDDDAQLSRPAVTRILEAFPQAAIFVRAYDRRAVIRLSGLDVAGVTREVYESAIDMGREVIRSLGGDDETVDQVVEVYRQDDAERFVLQTDSGSIESARDLIIRQTRRGGA